MQDSSNVSHRFARNAPPGSPSSTGTGRRSIGGASPRVTRLDGTGMFDDPAPFLGSSNSQLASRRSLACAASVVRYVDAEDISGFENFVKQLSLSQLTLAFAPERAVRGGEDAQSPVLIAVKTGNLPLIRAVIKWVPDNQVTAVLTSKGENDGRTVLMLAAATGESDVFEAIAKRIPRAHIQEQMSAQCVMGNTICMYAVKTGRPDVIEAIFKRFPSNQVINALCVKNFLGEAPLVHSARAPEPGAFMAIAKMLPMDKLAAQLEAKTEEGQTALHIATRSGYVSTWRAVTSRMSSDEVNRQMVSTDIYGETLVIMSVRSGNAKMFHSVVGRLTEDQVLTQLGARNKQGQTPAQVAVACGADSVLAAMVRPGWVSACLLDAPDESEAQLTALDLAVRPPAKINMLRCLLACGATPTARMILKLIRNSAKIDAGGGGCGEGGVVKECLLGAVAASEWTTNPLIPGLNLSVALMDASRQSSDLRQLLKELRADVDALVLSVLRHLPDTVAGFDRLAAPTISTRAKSRGLPRVSTLKRVVNCGVSVGAVDDGSNDNKTSLGSTIAQGVPRSRASIPEGVPALGVGITLVQEMLEPELAGRRSRHCAGPLAQAVQSRHLEFLCTPLVVDYLRLKFSAGLPNPFRDTEWRREHRRMDRDLARFMLDEDESKLRVYILQGGCADSPRQAWTYLPGLQFILAGLVGKTAAFFGVPAMRLALDVIVYFGVIAVFVTKVMVLEEAGTITPWELLWLGYLLGAVWQQMREIQEAGSIRMHFFNAWNLVEATMLASLSVAMFFRVWAFACDGEGQWFCGNHGRPDDTDVSSLNEVYLAQYFQAASAPFVLGRVLFLTQIHSSLGPLMHSTFQIFTDLAQFGALMLFIVLGFALAFYAMFGSKSASLPEGAAIEQYDTYFSSMLTLFGSMLGSFDFTIFDGAPLGEAGVILLVFFLCVMNVTLLNLLIAILATAHAKVEANADKEAMLSEALIITQYRRAMRSDSLPSPLNVPQELMCHLFWRNKERTKEVFARAVFWLISGPIAIATTAVLWAASLPLTLAWGYRVIRSNGAPMLVPALLGIGFNLGLAPMVTAWMWIEGVVGVWRQTNGSIETSDLNEIEASRAHRRRHFGSISSAGSPTAASVATAAVAALARTPTANTTGGVDSPPGDSPVSPRHNGSGGGTSNAWKRAADKSKRLRREGHAVHPMCAGDDDDGDTGTTWQQGFDVVAAVRSLHGLTVQQLREQLDEGLTSPCKEKEEVYRRYDSFSKALENVQKGHDRLEAMIRKSDQSRTRMDDKLEQLMNKLIAGNTATAAALAATAAPPVIASPSVARHAGRRETGASPRGIASPTWNQEGGDPSAETTGGLDAFIDDYHAEVSSR